MTEESLSPLLPWYASIPHVCTIHNDLLTKNYNLSLQQSWELHRLPEDSLPHEILVWLDWLTWDCSLSSIIHTSVSSSSWIYYYMAHNKKCYVSFFSSFFNRTAFQIPDAFQISCITALEGEDFQWGFDCNNTLMLHMLLSQNAIQNILHNLLKVHCKKMRTSVRLHQCKYCIHVEHLCYLFCRWSFV